ncbi:hypothetical protein GCK32_004140 [Trichostrongylus colubriformis]|uniref:Uncharacterized protein n=1 Tax=Trichostrongylus colubriformis TaxID=6319 RepID=A0AAN8IJC9_TRICO
MNFRETEYTGAETLPPAEHYRLVEDHTVCAQGECHDDASDKAQGVAAAAKEKLNDAGRTIKNTAEKISDKAGELKDKAKDAISSD